MIDFRFYLITDRKLHADRCSLISAVRRALKGGVTAVQLREKDLGTRELLKLSYRMRTLTDEFGARLFINDRFDIALAVGADGVHLTQKSIPAGAVRAAAGRKLLIGVSTHSISEARAAERGGADFITFGPVYRTPSKLGYGPPAGLDALRRAAGRISIPVFAVGGIKSRRLGDVHETGAHGVALISEVFGARHIEQKAGELLSLIQNTFAGSRPARIMNA
ncbi:MAG: thiamine phosphate synthase [Nitrospiraceae bacterium]|nr:MAG: thiamine phosphate synthase [Nitrospiraceae bacterium]